MSLQRKSCQDGTFFYALFGFFWVRRAFGHMLHAVYQGVFCHDLLRRDCLRRDGQIGVDTFGLNAVIT